MKRIHILTIIFALFVISQSSFAAENADIKGKVTDASTHQPLPGAAIYISDLKASTLSDANGEFIFKDLPARGKFLIEVRYIGYKTTSKLVDLSSQGALDFALEPSVLESAEVVITGTPNSANSKTNSLAVATVNREMLRQAAGTNLLDAVSKVPGVSQITTGGAISKPSIRGLGYSRVLTMVNGAREEAQQWGDEHGIEADQFSASRVEILKGPASLLYGSDALGGVINIIDDLFPAQGTFSGDFTTSYATNNGLSGSSLMMQGNTEGFVYRGRVSYKNAHSFQYGNRVVPNSGFNETDVTAMTGLNKTWGYSHLTLSRFNSNIGLVEDGPDGNGNFVDESGNLISNEEARTRKIDLPFQNINHYRAALNSNVLVGGGQLKSTFAFQKNIRKEFEEEIDEPGLRLDLDSYTYDLKYSFAHTGVWEPTVGVQGMFQTNKNGGEEFLIPDYASQTIGVFAYLKRNINGGALNGGIRYDYKTMDGKELTAGGTPVFSAFNNRFSNISGSLGLAYELGKDFIFRANVGSGFRAPNIAELGANGRHEGTFRYEIGNSALKQETSLQFDMSLEYTGETFSVGLNTYNNRIYNYIYSGHFNNETRNFTDDNGNTSTLPVYRFVQTNANLAGGEASVDIHPFKLLHIENSLSYVRGENLTTTSALPFIPAVTLNNELRLEPEINGLTGSFLKIGISNVFKQTRFDAFETETDGYTLLNAGIGASVKTRKSKVNIWITGQNLTDKVYYDHLSRYKPVGIYNMGRNITFGISTPLF